MADEDQQQDRIFIREAADMLNRRMATIRKWDRDKALPPNLRPKREESGRKWRYWTPEQIAGILAWIAQTDRRPGKGLPHFDPSLEQVDKMIERMRKPRDGS